MNLSPTLTSYFQAGNDVDADAFLSCFAPEAVVEDENETHQGPEEIRRWFLDTRAKYEFTAEVLRAREESGESVVACNVSGNFPGSPVELDYAFTLEEDKIVRLRIA